MGWSITFYIGNFKYDNLMLKYSCIFNVGVVSGVAHHILYR